MQICRVVGTVVSTQKNKKLEGAKLMLVQPLTLEDTPRGTTLLAIDSVGAGIGEKVLVVIEGKAAGDALGKKAAAVDAAIIGIIDAASRSGHERRRAAGAGPRDARAPGLQVRRRGAPGSRARLLQFTSHPSHYRYALPPSDGPCLIEPAVPCNHCGYCQSHGH